MDDMNVIIIKFTKMMIKFDKSNN
uniref:Uncharacterized protein n=1 Tax=Wuchereria bancrofti TaxID=6293 RepID=A0AAF5Q3W8_WUCBA